METVENNSASSTHQEKAKKLRKLRRWQVVISLLGNRCHDLGSHTGWSVSSWITSRPKPATMPK